jgi:predicted Zn-dependent protease
MTTDPNESSEPIDLEGSLLEATRLVEEDREDEALQMLLDLEREHSDVPTLLCMIGALAEQSGAAGMAVDYFRRCLALEPSEPQLLMTAGAGLAGSGDPAAEPALRAAALLAPDMAAARMHYGIYLVRTGLLEEGLAELDAARELEPENPTIARETGIAHLLGGQLARAVEQLEGATAALPDDPELGLLFALALVQAGDAAAAAEHLHPLGAAHPEHVDSQVVLALTAALQGWEDEAWLALSRAEASESVDPALLREIEEALEEGEDALQGLLTDHVAPLLLRERLYGG